MMLQQRAKKGMLIGTGLPKKHVYVTLPYDLTITIAQYCLGMVLFANNRQPILEHVNNSPFFSHGTSISDADNLSSRRLIIQ